MNKYPSEDRPEGRFLRNGFLHILPSDGPIKIASWKRPMKALPFHYVSCAALDLNAISHKPSFSPSSREYRIPNVVHPHTHNHNTLPKQ